MRLAVAVKVIPSLSLIRTEASAIPRALPHVGLMNNVFACLGRVANRGKRFVTGDPAEKINRQASRKAAVALFRKDLNEIEHGFPERPVVIGILIEQARALQFVLCETDKAHARVLMFALMRHTQCSQSAPCYD